MGKRVNLAALAEQDFYEQPAAAANEQAPVPERPSPEPRTALRGAEQPREVSAEPPSGPRLVPLSALATNPLNKRHPGDDDQILEMAETIRQHGVIQPLVVCSAEAYLAAFPDQRAAIADAAWVTLIGNRRLGA